MRLFGKGRRWGKGCLGRSLNLVFGCPAERSNNQINEGREDVESDSGWHGKAPFESLKALFEQETARSAETNVQLCVYHRGECVVDLWSSKTGTQILAQTVWLTHSAAVRIGGDRHGVALRTRLDRLQRPVTEYWPAFGGNGKQDLTVADVMRHEGGMASLEISIDPADLLPDRIKENAIGQR